MGTPLKRRHFTAIGSSSVKMVADRQRLIIRSTGDELFRMSTSMTLNDFQPPK